MSADLAQTVTQIAQRARAALLVPGLLVLSVVSTGGIFAATTPDAQEQKSPGTPVVFQAAGPVAVPREKQFDFTSRINGQTYRLMISAPLDAGRNEVCPVFYVLDGNWYFRAASDTATWGSGTMVPAVVVGIGYPTEDNAEVRRRRTFDMTLSAPSPDSAPGLYGGGDVFLRVIEEEVKPFVAARYKIDSTRQIIYGKSLGGLMVLRSMFRHPTSFGTYIAASPAISQHGGEVLADEKAFSARVRAGELHLKLLLTSAGDEQYRGTDPKLLAAAQVSRMIDNVSELATRLAALDSQNLTVVRTIFPDEDHHSVSLASIGRAVRFALEPPSPAKP